MKSIAYLSFVIALYSAFVHSTPPPSTHSVTIAGPIDYTLIANSALGLNEKGKGIDLNNHVETVTIKDIHGEDFVLHTAWQTKPALIVFYRGGWCPYCNAQVREMSQQYGKLEASGVQTVLISVDTPDKTAMLKATYNIPFPVLSDPELIAHKAFNVVFTPDAATRNKMLEYGIDLPAWSGENHGQYAVASAFIIDSHGHVVFSHAPADFRSRPSVDQLVKIIKGLNL